MRENKILINQSMKGKKLQTQIRNVMHEIMNNAIENNVKKDVCVCVFVCVCVWVTNMWVMPQDHHTIAVYRKKKPN